MMLKIKTRTGFITFDKLISVETGVELSPERKPFFEVRLNGGPPKVVRATDKDGGELIFRFDTPAYLLNDLGDTIERI